MTTPTPTACRSLWDVKHDILNGSGMHRPP
jgi:hypothetical protein